MNAKNPKQEQIIEKKKVPTELKFLELERAFKQNNVKELEKIIYGTRDPDLRKQYISNTLKMVTYHDFRDNYDSVIQMMLRNNLNPDTKINGQTLIMIENDSTNLNTVNMLLEKGANPNLKDSDGNTVLSKILNNHYYNHTKKQQNSIDFMELLLSNKADMNSKNNNGETPLMQAFWSNRNNIGPTCGNIQAARKLIEIGADLNIRDNTGETAFMKAIRGSFNNEAKMMIEKGVPLDVRSKTGETALIIACKAENIEMAQTLINLGANLDIRDYLRKTAYNYAKPSIQQMITMRKILDEKNKSDDKNSPSRTWKISDLLCCRSNRGKEERDFSL